MITTSCNRRGDRRDEDNDHPRRRSASATTIERRDRCDLLSDGRQRLRRDVAELSTQLPQSPTSVL